MAGDDMSPEMAAAVRIASCVLTPEYRDQFDQISIVVIDDEDAIDGAQHPCRGLVQIVVGDSDASAVETATPRVIHLLAHALAGNDHGDKWQAVMRAAIARADEQQRWAIRNALLSELERSIGSHQR